MARGGGFTRNCILTEVKCRRQKYPMTCVSEAKYIGYFRAPSEERVSERSADKIGGEEMCRRDDTRLRRVICTRQEYAATWPYVKAGSDIAGDTDSRDRELPAEAHLLRPSGDKRRIKPAAGELLAFAISLLRAYKCYAPIRLHVEDRRPRIVVSIAKRENRDRPIEF